MAADDNGSAGRGPTNFGFVALRTGTRLDNRYTIEHVIAAGGFGVTYYAHHEGLGRACAIKEHFPRQFAVRDEVTSKVHASDQEIFSWALDRFLQEGRALAQCKHPNVVEVADVFEANGTAYMVLDYERGTTMRRWLDALGRRPTQAEIDGILAPLLDALAFVHAQGLLHRDLAPDNIMIRADGQPCLIDFGAARQAIAQRSHVLSAIVKSGYSPPEQYTTSGKSQGPWSDIYALGATVYHAISGQAPVESTERQLEDELKPAAEAVAAPADYRPAFLAAIDAALRLKHTERPRSVVEWRAMLLPSAAGASIADTAAENATERPALARRPEHDAKAAAISGTPSGPAVRDAGHEPRNARAKVPYLIAAGIAAVAVAGLGFTLIPASKTIGANRQTATASVPAPALLPAPVPPASAPAPPPAPASVTQRPIANSSTSAPAPPAYLVAGKTEAEDVSLRASYEAGAAKGDARAQANLGYLYETALAGLARDDTEARRYYKLAADQGDGAGQSGLGSCYANGCGGLAKNEQEAARLYRLAAGQGDARGRNNLGGFYANGKGGLARSDGDAVRLYKLAADQGLAQAQGNLGSFHVSGRGGLPKDDQEAVRLFRLAADQGNATGQNGLAVFHAAGRGGLLRNDSEAVRFYQLAADQGFAPAQANLGWFTENGRGGRDRNDQEAARLYKLAVDQGNAVAQNNLGVFYANGRGGLDQNDQEAARLYQLAANQGHALAQSNLGAFYANGRGGLDQNDQEAARLYRLGADQGNAQAQANLGVFHSNGRGGLARNDEEAVRLYMLAADQGNATGQNGLGHFHQTGRGGIAKNVVEAARYFKLAADQGNATAQANLGHFHENGRGGLAKNRQEAVRLYKLAADQGNTFAQTALKRLKIKR